MGETCWGTQVEGRRAQAKVEGLPAKTIQAFLFDMDGTLVDTEYLYIDATQMALKEKGHLLDRSKIREIVYGRSQTDVSSDLYELFPDVDPEELRQRTGHFHSRISGQEDIRIHSSIALLKRLAADYPVAVVSGSPRDAVCDYVDLISASEHISFLLGSEDYRPGKPDPTCYLMAAEKLGIDPVRCLVFEDSTVGVKAAKAAGMSCIALKREGMPYQDFTTADLVLSDLDQFRLEDWL
jgi:sugar-phosphatase